MGTLPLSGITVVEMCHAWAGPHAGELLSDLGAQVIKVEGPEGDMMRGGRHPSPGSGVFLFNQIENEPWNRNAIFGEINRGKLSVGLNLNVPEGKHLFFKLLGIADIFICNLAVGSINKLGFSYDAIKKTKPDIIYITINAYGLDSPWAEYRVYGVVLEPLSGFFSLTGYADDDRPMRSGVDHIDPISGTHAVGAALAALLHRKKTGIGQHINLSFLESAVNFIGPEVLDYTMNGRIQGTKGNRCTAAAPQGCYRCEGEDQWVSISVRTDEEWRLFCQVINRPELAENSSFNTMTARQENHDELDRLINEWTLSRNKKDIMESMQKAGIACGMVLDLREVLANEHLQQRGFFQTVIDSTGGTYPIIGSRPKLSGIRNKVNDTASKYGEHNDYVFGNLLGFSQQQISEYKAKSAILSEPV